jgi:hypothetical protein
MSLIKLVENSNLGTFLQARVPCGIKDLFDVQGHRGRRPMVQVVEIKGHIVSLASYVVSCCDVHGNQTGLR